MTNSIAQWGDKIISLGLSVPAIMLLECCKPLSGLIRHGREVTGEWCTQQTPLLESFTQLFSEREKLEELIQYLEQKSV